MLINKFFHLQISHRHKSPRSKRVKCYSTTPKTNIMKIHWKKNYLCHKNERLPVASSIPLVTIKNKFLFDTDSENEICTNTKDISSNKNILNVNSDTSVIRKKVLFQAVSSDEISKNDSRSIDISQNVNTNQPVKIT